MGGICLVAGRGGPPADPHLIDQMVRATSERAAGGVGRYTDPALDVASFTPAGGAHGTDGLHAHQQSGVVVAADARLDNRAELLRALGPDRPQDASGAAAIIAAAYHRWGAQLLPRLLGDLALAIWDPRRASLLLARDPMAMRSLHYRVEPERTLVATQVSQLLAVPGVPDDLDERMVASYLAQRFGAPDWTFYAGIAQVPPGEAVLITPSEARTWCWWDADPTATTEQRTPGEHAEELRALYVEAVEARTREASSIGVLLSGGVDSGAAASAAGWLAERGQLEGRIHTYAWDFGSFTSCDERQRSQLIVDRYGLSSREVPVEDAGPLAEFPAHAPDVDDPLHPAFQPMLERGFASAQQDGVGPLLTGMRGDLNVGPLDLALVDLLRQRRWSDLAEELWAGWRRHQRVGVEHPLRTIRHELAPTLRAAAARRVRQPHRALQAGASLPTGRGTAWSRAYPPWVAEALVERVDLPALSVAHGEPTPPDGLPGALRRRRYQWQLMRSMQRWSATLERRAASYGLELVDAWSDRRIVALCLAAPQAMLNPRGAPPKHLARQALTGIMPEGFRRAATKTVPRPVFLHQLRHQAVPVVRELLADSRAEAQGWIDARVLREDYERFVAGGPVPLELWHAVCFEWWLRVREGSLPAGSQASHSPEPGSADAAEPHRG